MIKSNKLLLEPQKRLEYFDILKFFAIALVVWGHAIQFFSIEYLDSFIYRCIYSFHMPLFMFIAGFFYASSSKLEFWSMLKKKFKQLILPCFVWAFIATIISTFLLDSTFHIQSILIKGVTNYWFLKCLFIFYMFAGICEKTKKYKQILLFAMLIFSQFIPFYQIPAMYQFFLLGILVREYQNLILRYKNYICFACMLVFSVMICFFDKSFWSPISIRSIFFNANYHDIELFFYQRTFRFFIGTSGCLFFYLFAYNIVKFSVLSEISKKIAYFGTITMPIYILQQQIFYILRRYIHIDYTNFTIYNTVTTPIISLLVFIMCVSIIYIVSKNKLLNKLLFGM